MESTGLAGTALLAVTEAASVAVQPLAGLVTVSV
jgi:hypothetical protein